MAQVFLIDTDTASDDAVALIMALRAPEVRVAAITVVAGNVGVEQATRNALYTVELCGAKVPVFAGAEKPLLRAPESATWFHGRDGLGDHNYPPPRQSPEKLHAVEALIEAIEANPGLVLVTLGPLTNIALIGWHLCRGEAVLNEADISRVSGFNTELARFAIECNSTARNAYKVQTGEDGISLPDPVAMSLALDPTVGTEWSTHYVDIETHSELTRGMTVVDRLNVAADQRNRTVWADVVSRKPNAKVCWSLDNQRWKKALYSALQQP